MAARFGAVRPAHTYAARLQWLVMCLVSVIIFLVGTLVFVATNTTAMENPVVVNGDSRSLPPVSGTIDILVAASRIEEGTRLSPNLFTELSVDADKAPTAVVRAQDRVMIIGRFAKSLINANSPIVLEQVTDEAPTSSLPIPAGYRATTIRVDSRSGVEGFAKPDKRVDVLWLYAAGQGEKKLATIARYVKILSVGGTTQTNNDKVAVNVNGTTVTLLVTEKDAKKIELARSLGELSLTLVGEQETLFQNPDPDVVTVEGILNPNGKEEPQIAIDGMMYSRDPATGRNQRYVLRKNRWSRDSTYTDTES